jgi:hypothetical protein
LPSKTRKTFYSIGLVDVKTASALDLSNEIRDRDPRWNRNRKMDVIGHDSYCVQHRTVFIARVVDRSIEDQGNLIVNGWLAELRRPDEMAIVLPKRHRLPSTRARFSQQQTSFARPN